MKAPLFNIHDLILLLTVAVCLLLAGFQFFHAAKKSISTTLLSVFFLCVAASAWCRLLLWDNRIYVESVTGKMLLPYLLTTGALLQGVSLYLYVRSITRQGFQLQKRAILHLLPMLICYCLIGLIRIDSDDLRFIGTHLTDRAVYFTNLLWWLLKALPAIYGSGALVLTLRFMHGQKNYYSETNVRGIAWLNVLTVGFCINWLWSLLVSTFGQAVSAPLADTLGIADNYITFVLIVALFLYDLVYARRMLLARVEEIPLPAPPSPSALVVDKIKHGMEVDQLYLKHNLNIEEFSRQVGVPYREVSFIINRHFNSNFFEYVNQYRVARARTLLADPAHQGRTVLDICLDSGFNSKSAFNRFFKRYTGKSPTAFREDAQSQGEREH